MADILTHIHFGVRDLNVPNHWRALADDFKMTRPTVLMLGGDGCRTPADANGYLKTLNWLMQTDDQKSKGYDVIAAYYEGPQQDAMYERQIFFADSHQAIKKLNTWVQFLYDEWQREAFYEREGQLYDKYRTPHYIHELYTRFLRPLIATPTGKRVPLEVAEKRAGRLNLVAHCHGAFVALKAEEMMCRDMNRLGYSAAEQDKILGQVGLVVCSPEMLPFGKTRFMTTHFASALDEHLFRYADPDSSPAASVQKKLSSAKHPFSSEGQMMKIFSSREVLWMTKELTFPSSSDEHQFRRFAEKRKMTPAGRYLSFILTMMLRTYIARAIFNERPYPSRRFLSWRERFSSLPLIVGRLLQTISKGRNQMIQKRSYLFLKAQKER